MKNCLSWNSNLLLNDLMEDLRFELELEINAKLGISINNEHVIKTHSKSSKFMCWWNGNGKKQPAKEQKEMKEQKEQQREQKDAQLEESNRFRYANVVSGGDEFLT